MALLPDAYCSASQHLFPSPTRDATAAGQQDAGRRRRRLMHGHEPSHSATRSVLSHTVLLRARPPARGGARRGHVYARVQALVAGFSNAFARTTRYAALTGPIHRPIDSETRVVPTAGPGGAVTKGKKFVSLAKQRSRLDVARRLGHGKLPSLAASCPSSKDAHQLISSRLP